MRVLNWAQTRLHGAQYSTKKPEFSAGSSRAADTEPRRNDELPHRWPSAMLSIGTFGVVEGHRDEELISRKIQEELTLLMSAKGGEDDKASHPTLKRSLSTVGLVKQRSFRKFMSSALSSLLPTPSFRGTMPIPWPLPHNNIPNDNSGIKSYETARLTWRANNAMMEQQGNKWITTDSEYIVLEMRAHMPDDSDEEK